MTTSTGLLRCSVTIDQAPVGLIIGLSSFGEGYATGSVSVEDGFMFSYGLHSGSGRDERFAEHKNNLRPCHCR